MAKSDKVHKKGAKLEAKVEAKVDTIVRKPEKVKDDKKKKDKTVTPHVKVPVSSKEILAKAAKKVSSKNANGKAKEKVDKTKESSDESEESSSEDEKPKVAQLKSALPRPALSPPHGDDSDDSSDDSEDEHPPPVTIAKASSKLVPASKQVAPANAVDSDSSDGSLEDSDDEHAPPVTITKAPSAKVVPASKRVVPANAVDADSSDDSSEDFDNDAPSVTTSKTTRAKVVPALKQIAPTNSVDTDSGSDSGSDDNSEVVKSAAKEKVDSESDDSSQSDDDDDKAEPEKMIEDSSESDADGDVKMADSVSAVNGSNKRKATDDAQPQAKKVKLDGDAPEESKTIFVGRLSWSVDNDRLAQEFAHCGEVESANVQMDRDSGKSRGFGYVRFTTSEAVEKALLMNGQEIDGRAVNIDRSTAPDKSQARDKRAKAFGDHQTSPPSSTLFVGNLSFDVSEDTVWSFFNDYGVKSVRLPTDRDTGRPKGFGYVEFEDVDGAKKAFEATNGADIEGRNIRLDYSQPRDSSGGNRGGRGFGDRGGRGGGRGFGDRGGRGSFGDRGRGGYGDRGRGGFGDRGRGGRSGDRGSGGRGRGAPRGMSKSGGIAAFEGKKITF